ncbi:hypothetical protein TeGR_g8627 [Tetraparma gracilis]|uniref:Uncharacterized protein n=1 Tax=Tetraparma gracilis TaxID=2962635 RepID=A0ABQ6MVK8_9STRA|nr:hypothetical protein TeGR_g8627 [Tetraparma gracilis]
MSGETPPSDPPSDPPLALPEHASTSHSGPPPRSLALGSTLDLAELGPIIISSDGTTKRISNWDAMSAAEQEKAWGRIAERNKRRLEALRAEGKGLDIEQK